MRHEPAKRRTLHWAPGILGLGLGGMLLRRKRPFLASHKLTYRCNLGCDACPFKELQQSPHPSFDTLADTMRTLRKRGNLIVVLEGGEPTLWRDGERDIHDVVSLARGIFPVVAMTTNGTHDLNIGTDLLWVSLDGVGEVHDGLRCGSFDRVMENIRASEHPKLMLHTTLSTRNLGEIEALARLAADTPNIRGMTFQLYFPYSGLPDELALSGDQRRSAIDRILDLKRRGLPILNSSGALHLIGDGSWPCDDWLIDNAEPDGEIRNGCYVLANNGQKDCGLCGFTPYTEATLALRGHAGSILAGWRIFLS